MAAKKTPTDQSESSALNVDAEKFTENVGRIVELSTEMAQEMLSSPKEDGMALSMPLAFGSALVEATASMMADPSKAICAQLDFYKSYFKLVEDTTQRFLGQEQSEKISQSELDRRFKDKAWQEGLVFNFIKQAYFLTSSWLTNTVNTIDGVDDKTKQKIDFYTRQWIDAISPSNYFMTNPEVLKTTIESNGENLVKGMEHLLSDLRQGKGMLQIKTTDQNAFEFGKNIATTPGKVVYQNDLLQLIQYQPTTKQVFKTPLFIVSPWINKYYILDLKPENSFVKWLTDQGYTVFITSWVNPDERHAHKSFGDYMQEGIIDALDAIEKATGESSTNVIGYCLGGTLLASTLAYLTAKKQDKRISSATFLTTLVDFSNPGDLGVFIDEAQLEKVEEHIQRIGFFDGKEMALVFSMLRANDMIWSFVINNYLLGKDPFPFDLLYWNADSTRMPAAMHIFYLRNMYLKNLLTKPGGIELKGVPIDLTTVKTPSYIISTRKDHIAPWQATYAATQLYKGLVTFVLTDSGHVAGVVNPPSAKKYCYWTNDSLPISPEAWFEKAKEHAGSWWDDWNAWIQAKGFAGPKVPARIPGSGKLKPLEDAPGSYVKVHYE